MYFLSEIYSLILIDTVLSWPLNMNDPTSSNQGFPMLIFSSNEDIDLFEKVQPSSLFEVITFTVFIRTSCSVESVSSTMSIATGSPYFVDYKCSTI